jgi:hypothetical protein
MGFFTRNSKNKDLDQSEIESLVRKSSDSLVEAMKICWPGISKDVANKFFKITEKEFNSLVCDVFLAGWSLRIIVDIATYRDTMSRNSIQFYVYRYISHAIALVKEMTGNVLSNQQLEGFMREAEAVMMRTEPIEGEVGDLWVHAMASFINPSFKRFSPATFAMFGTMCFMTTKDIASFMDKLK